MTEDSLADYCSTLTCCLLLGGLALLSGCTKTLNTSPLESEIRDTIIRQGGLSLKAVVCPRNIPLEAGKSFECVGELESGEQFAIPARQANATEKVEWDVPNVKGLLNLVKLETLFQETLKTEEGETLAIKCGTGYKVVKPGESFECQIKQPDTKPAVSLVQSAKPSQKASTKAENSQQVKRPKQLQAILVTIDPESNVNWRQIISVLPDKSVATKSSATSSVPNSAALPAAARANLSEETQKDVEERSD